MPARKTKSVVVAKKPVGRPSIYTPALAATICERLASGESLRSICTSPGMPSWFIVHRWLLDGKHLDFYQQYVHAREVQADFYAEEIVQIADTPMVGVKTKTDENGNVETTEGDMIDHRRLRVDARKWTAARLAPKKYGDRSALEHSGPGGGPMQFQPVINLLGRPDPKDDD
jgi:hypothetical protein